MVKSFYNNSAVIVLCYDITNRVSFDNIEMWLKEARDNTQHDSIIVLIGNMSDKEDKR